MAFAEAVAATNRHFRPFPWLGVHEIFSLPEKGTLSAQFLRLHLSEELITISPRAGRDGDEGDSFSAQLGNPTKRGTFDVSVRLMDIVVTAGLAVALLVAILAVIGFRQLSLSWWGRIALLVAVAGLPLAATTGGVASGINESSRTRFCLRCHEMQDYGKSLFVDDRRALPAVHYQNRLIDREGLCYSCHTDYAMFGDLKAKFNGLKHVWVHYLGEIPEDIELYEPYSNQNCLHCHEDARRFIEAEPHQNVLQAMSQNEVSCLSCHNVVHDLSKVANQEFWQAQ